MKKILLFCLPVFLLTGCAQPGKVPLEEGGEKKVTSSGKKVLMVVAPVNFRDEEFLRPKEIFEKNGIQVTVASKGVIEASGLLGAKTKVDLDILKIDPTVYDALIFVGGPGASVYFNDQAVLSLVKRADEQGKVVGAICISPSILANAGILSGKRVTSWPTERGNLESKGAVYIGERVVVDGRIVTAKGPEEAIEYGEKIVELLER